MHTFTIRDLRDRTGELVRAAEGGELAVVTKHGNPVFVAVPFDELLLQRGVNTSMAVRLFQDKHMGLNRAARLAGVSLEAFMELLGDLEIPLIDLDQSELEHEFRELES